MENHVMASGATDFIPQAFSSYYFRYLLFQNSFPRTFLPTKTVSKHFYRTCLKMLLFF